MSRFWWVRHGPTHAKTMIGWTDLPADLSDHAALARLSAHLPQNGLVISSDLRRAVATADAIAGTRLRLPHDAALREIHFGAWEKRSHAEVEAETPALIRAFWDNPGDIRPPGGESWNDLRQRIGGAVDRLAMAHRGRDIVVVAHFGAILAAMQHGSGLGTAEVLSQRIDNLSVTRIDPDRGGCGPINHLP